MRVYANVYGSYLVIIIIDFSYSSYIFVIVNLLLHLHNTERGGNIFKLNFEKFQLQDIFKIMPNKKY